MPIEMRSLHIVSARTKYLTFYVMTFFFWCDIIKSSENEPAERTQIIFPRQLFFWSSTFIWNSFTKTLECENRLLIFRPADDERETHEISF